MNRENRRPITLEDIIRLKRAERPPAQFWDEFDRELRAKQLTALLEKRPWWRSLSWNLPRFARYSLPLGAASILAITFVATREAQTVPPDFALSPTPAFALEQTSAPLRTEIAAGVENQAPTPPQAQVETVLASIDVVPSVGEPALGEVTAPSPVFAGFKGVGRTAAQPRTVSASEMTRTDRAFASELLVGQAASPVGQGLLAADGVFESRNGVPRPQVVNPLSQMTGPAAARSAKLNSAFAASYNREQPDRASERVARRLSSEGDERLYSTVSRIKARGNEVGLRF